MQTPTLDHTEPRQEGCRCTPYALCAECYGRLARHRADRQLDDWLRCWGNMPDPGAPKRG